MKGGKLYYNNDFNAMSVKRIYFIENSGIKTQRSWQGHRIEQRWFSVVTGHFKIEIIKVENWVYPKKALESQSFVLNSETLDVLHIMGGYVTSIQFLKEYSFGEKETNTI